MQTTDAQVRTLMAEYSKHGKIGVAAARSGMCPDSASTYLREGKLPSELAKPRTWRTRPDPFAEDGPELEARLRAAPGPRAKTLFDHLVRRKPGAYTPGQLRTLQRRVRRFLALEGPPKEVYFAQDERPGEAMQTDFTRAHELGITIRGEPFPQLLCRSVLPCSNWRSTTVRRSESMLALKRGVQRAVHRLGRIPE